MRSAFLALIFLAGSVTAQIKIDKDIVYGKAGERELKLDMAKPNKGDGPFPVVVCVHGGGWRMGNKKDMHPWLTMLAERGYLAVSVGYRLAPEYHFPAQIEDCKTAIRFLRANAKNYNIQKDRVGAIGYSAGGHLVDLLGLTDPKAGFEGKEYLTESSEVQCVVDYFGPTDLAAFGKDDSAQRSMLAPLIGAKYTEKPKAHEHASPINHVKNNAPPFLIFHGTKDWIVPIEQSTKFAEKLKAANVDVTYVQVPDEGHGWSGPVGMQSTKQTIQFFEKHLKK